jgi:hypothetical protein
MSELNEIARALITTIAAFIAGVTAFLVVGAIVWRMLKP